MKPPPTYLVIAAVAAASIAQAQQDFKPDGPAPANEMIKYTLLKPADKTSEVVKPAERNPFAKADEGHGPSQKSLNEENLIRERLEKLRVVGVSPGARGLRVMLGDIVLEADQIVPQLLPDQTVALKVGAITPQAIELLWLEVRGAGLPPRKLTIPVDLRPYVRYQLKGHPTEKNQWEKEKDAKTETLPVGRVFPEVSAASPALRQLVQNRPIPRAVPVEEPAPRNPVELPAETTGAAPAPPAPQGSNFVNRGPR
jgi:hypothetical protein